MSKLTTDDIKEILKTNGFTNIKRVSKKKNEDKNIVREFSSDQGKIEVISNQADSIIIAIDSSHKVIASKFVIPTPADSLQPLITVDKTKFLKHIEEHELDIDENIDFSETKEVLAIPSIELKILSPSSFDLYDYESFLIKMNSGENYVLNTYYGIMQSLERDSIKTKEAMTGVYIECDHELEEPSSHCPMIIPKEAYALWLHPEYMQLIFISSDFLSGLTTSTCSNEASVEVNCKELLKIADVELKNSDMFDKPAIKKLSKYAFVNYHN